MLSVADLTARLRGHWQLIQVQEQQMAECWRDTTYLRFKQQHWALWESRVPALFSVVEAVEEVMHRAQTETVDP